MKRAIGLLATTLLMPGCGIFPTLAPGGGATHQVTYVVRCDECRVAYSVSNDRMEEAAARGMWTKKVAMSRSLSGTVRLTATPTRTGSLIRHAYIQVDGDILAETRRDSRAMFSDEVNLSAPLPTMTRVGGGR